jgi:hypothetical protein
MVALLCAVLPVPLRVLRIPERRGVLQTPAIVLLQRDADMTFFSLIWLPNTLFVSFL